MYNVLDSFIKSPKEGHVEFVKGPLAPSVSIPQIARLAKEYGSSCDGLQMSGSMCQLKIRSVDIRKISSSIAGSAGDGVNPSMLKPFGVRNPWFQKRT